MLRVLVLLVIVVPLLAIVEMVYGKSPFMVVVGIESFVIVIIDHHHHHH